MERERGSEKSGPGIVEATLGRMRWGAVVPLAAALALGFGFVRVMGLILRPLALLIIAITLAEALSPIAHWVEARTRRRSLAVVIVYLAALVIVGGLGWLIAPTLVGQAKELVQRAPGFVRDIQNQLTRGGLISPQDVAGFSASLQSRLGELVISAPQLVVQGAFDLVLVLFLSVYWLIAARAIRAFTLSLIPDRHRGRAGDVLHHMGHSMGGYVRGAVINAVIMGALAYFGLLMIGVRYPLALGVLTMMGEVVPIIGPIVVGVIVTAIALLDSLAKALLALGLFVALEQIEGHLLTPNIMRSQTDVPQTLVLFAIVVGAGVGGILGILVAIPVAAATRVLVLEVIAPTERKAIDRIAEQE